jgi:glycogen synthase
MNVVFVASEAVPFAKTGGLADAIGTLPCALSRLVLHVSVVIPCHREVWWGSGQTIEHTGRRVRVGSRTNDALIYLSILPLVRAIRDLADTVVDAAPATLAEGMAMGFTFLEPTSTALRTAIARALSFRADRASWTGLVENAMRSDWSWDRSAPNYVSRYDKAVRRARPRRETGVSLAIATSN